MTDRANAKTLGRSVIRRSETGRYVATPPLHKEAVKEISRALSRNYQRINKINERYGIKVLNSNIVPKATI
ncbi:hypothetical protein J9303_03360 [Bacillaceae bacterium Marseille-Q3522]|nr:hypothetical protein [Bacillaceae bacterium Marseille-Q3522]